MFKFFNGSFYPYALQQEYEASGMWPEGGVDVDVSVYELYTTIPLGKILASDENGMPTWIDAPEQALTYAQELTALTAPYNADRDTLCAAWLRAAVADGTEETVRKEDVESEIAELDAQYDADVAALKTKYGVN